MLPKIPNTNKNSSTKNSPKTPQKSFMEKQTKTLSELCEEQKPFYVQKFDTTPEEQDRIVREMVKNYCQNVKFKITVVSVHKNPDKNFCNSLTKY